MSKITFAIPIYSQQLSYGATLMQSRKDTNNEHIDLAFGCSSFEEANAIKKLVIKYRYNNIHIHTFECEHIGNKPLYKKHMLLNVLKNDYNYIACFDAEAIFTKHIPNEVLINEGNFPNILGSKLATPNSINEKCANLLKINSEDNEWVDIFFWFSNIPVYKSDNLLKFYKFFPNISKLSEEYDYFEYILYIYFVKTFSIMEVDIIDIGDSFGVFNGWSLECCSDFVINSLSDKKCRMPLWCWPKTYQKLDTAVKDHFYLLYHVDR
mgnify:CR=1 FL=1